MLGGFVVQPGQADPTRTRAPLLQRSTWRPVGLAGLGGCSYRSRHIVYAVVTDWSGRSVSRRPHGVGLASYWTAAASGAHLHPGPVGETKPSQGPQATHDRFASPGVRLIGLAETKGDCLRRIRLARRSAGTRAGCRSPAPDRTRSHALRPADPACRCGFPCAPARADAPGRRCIAALNSSDVSHRVTRFGVLPIGTSRGQPRRVGMPGERAKKTPTIPDWGLSLVGWRHSNSRANLMKKHAFCTARFRGYRQK